MYSTTFKILVGYATIVRRCINCCVSANKMLYGDKEWRIGNEGRSYHGLFYGTIPFMVFEDFGKPGEYSVLGRESNE